MRAMVAPGWLADDLVHARHTLARLASKDLAVLTTTAFSLGALRLPPFLTSAFAANDALRAAGPAGWPRDLPPPANRPDAALADRNPGEPVAFVAPSPFSRRATDGAAAGEWFDSSRELRSGLQVTELAVMVWADGLPA